MTHFVGYVAVSNKVIDLLKESKDIAVLRSELERILAPYDEKLRVVSPRKEYWTENDIACFKKEFETEIEDNGLSLKQAVEVYGEDWCGDECGMDRKGVYGKCTRNPNSRWDWWVIGGRWSGHQLLTKLYRDMDYTPLMFIDYGNSDIKLEDFYSEEDGFDSNALHTALEKSERVLADVFVLPPRWPWQKAHRWLARGKVGWFSTFTEEVSTKQWKEIIYRELRRYMDKYTLVTVDFHI